MTATKHLFCAEHSHYGYSLNTFCNRFFLVVNFIVMFSLFCSQVYFLVEYKLHIVIFSFTFSSSSISLKRAEERICKELRYFFMNPCQKYKAKKRKPFKLAIQIFKIALVTMQVQIHYLIASFKNYCHLRSMYSAC